MRRMELNAIETCLECNLATFDESFDYIIDVVHGHRGRLLECESMNDIRYPPWFLRCDSYGAGSQRWLKREASADKIC